MRARGGGVSRGPLSREGSPSQRRRCHVNNYIERADRNDRTSVETQPVKEHPCGIVGGSRWSAIQVRVVDVEDAEGFERSGRRHLA